MQTYHGKSVFGGVAIGKICVYQKGEQTVKRTHIADTEQEKKRFDTAVQTAIEQLGELYEKAVKEVGEDHAAIFEIHQMMLEDDDYLDAARHIIETQHVNAEYAVAVTGDNFAQMFADMDDEYMRGRAADVKDISERLVRVLSGNAGTGIHTEEPVIIVADDLAPSETVQLEKDKVLAFVTVHGSVNSHTAILARTMSIPALIGTKLPLDETIDGKLAAVDGIQNKNSGNILMKNMMDFVLGSIFFFIIGFALMFGGSNAFIGTAGFFHPKSLADADGMFNGLPIGVFMIFQTVFCATSATIVSGAMAERTKFISYLIYSAAISIFIYPITGHWIWGGGWLSQIGFHDFAGSTASSSLRYVRGNH